MTLDQLVVCSGVVLCIWLAGLLVLMAAGHRHPTVLDLGGPLAGYREGRAAEAPRAGAAEHAPAARVHRLRHAFGHR